MTRGIICTTFDKMLTEMSYQNCYYPEESEYYLDEYQQDGYFYESSAALKPVIKFCNGKAVWTKKLVKTVPQVRPFVKTVPDLKSNNILTMPIKKFLRSTGYTSRDVRTNEKETKSIDEKHASLHGNGTDQDDSKQENSGLKPQAATIDSSKILTQSQPTKESKNDSTEISDTKQPSQPVINALREEEETSAAKPDLNCRESKILLNNQSEANQGHCHQGEERNCQKDDNCMCCSKQPNASADSKKRPLKSAMKNPKTKPTQKQDKKVSFNIFVEAQTDEKELVTLKLNYICGIPKDETSVRSGAPSKAYTPPHLRRETGDDLKQTQIQQNIERSKIQLKRSSDEKRVFCRYYEKGCCQYGDKCRYYHNPAQKTGSRTSYHLRKHEGQRRISKNKDTSNRFS
ncbi:uncharacterized protein LOC136038071 [Artemia franciscana]|uniref:C3H1-type domain-containing protein n=1 Tax=Artemia franciscana TaxID=6661 RepID=A0AA88I647_ARTSF|nr:hypothetical protein QYM36_006156 [Artemia franciscana]